VCRADQCMGPGPEFRGPAGIRGPASSDVYDIYVCQIDMFVFSTNLCFSYTEIIFKS
jgi:hypothetical protein